MSLSVLYYHYCAVAGSGGSRPSDEGEGGGRGHPDPEIRRGPVLRFQFQPIFLLPVTISPILCRFLKAIWLVRILP